MITLAFVGLVGLVGVTACDAAPAPGSGPGTVVIGSARTGSPVPAWSAELERRFTAGMAQHATWTFVTADGRPSVAGSLPLVATGDNDLVKAEAGSAVRAEATRLLATLVATHPEVDLLAALDMAARSLTDRGEPRSIIVLDSMLQTAGALRFQDSDGAVLSADPAAVADQLAASGNLPPLGGIEVVLMGAGDTVAPQDPLPPPVRTALLALWTGMLQRAGATVTVVPAPVAATVAAGVPPVTPVPIAAPRVADGPVALSDSAVGFLPDRAVLRDPVAAMAALAPFIERLRPGKWHATLTGTTSSAGTPAGRLALSVERAAVVAGLLRAGGVPGTAVESRGVGTDFPGFVPDRDGSGQLDPILAARNRQVIIELVPVAA